jgi:hypothetical protein
VPTYDAMPQRPVYEDSKRVLYNEMYEQRYGALELVEKAMAGNANANEWFGRDISRRAPRIVPEGYRWDRRNQVLVPNGWAFCCHCKKVKPVTEFGKDERNRGRDGTRSYCSGCEAKMQTPRNRKAQRRHWKQWKRG